MGVGSKKIRVGCDVAWGLARRGVVVGVDGHGTDDRCFCDVNGARVQDAALCGRVAIQGVIDVICTCHRQGHRKRACVVASLHAECWRGDVPCIHVEGIRAVRSTWRGHHANLPARCTVGRSAPAVVGLRGAHVGAKDVALEHRFRRVAEHQGLVLALVDLEVGIQEATHVEVGQQFTLAGAHDQQVSTGGHHRASRNFKFVQVGGVVCQEVPSQVHVGTRGVVELHKIFVVTTNAQGVVAAGKLVDDHLGLRLGPSDRRQQRNRPNSPKVLHRSGVIALQTLQPATFVHW